MGLQPFRADLVDRYVVEVNGVVLLDLGDESLDVDSAKRLFEAARGLPKVQCLEVSHRPPRQLARDHAKKLARPVSRASVVCDTDDVFDAGCVDRFLEKRVDGFRQESHGCDQGKCEHGTRGELNEMRDLET